MSYCLNSWKGFGRDYIGDYSRGHKAGYKEFRLWLRDCRRQSKWRDLFRLWSFRCRVLRFPPWGFWVQVWGFGLGRVV